MVVQCGSPIIKKNGHKNGTQQYKCHACGKNFLGGNRVTKETIWRNYLHGKQTVKDLSSIHGISESTVKRHLRGIRENYVCDKLPKRGIVLMDTTYWGRNWGLLIMLDSESSRVLWRKYVSHERLCDYKEGTDYLRKQGYEIKGIVCDGLRGIFQMLSEYPVQMCQFHKVDYHKL